MRKVIPVLLGILLFFSLSACNRGGEGSPAVPNATAGASGEKTEATQESVQETVFVPVENYMAKITMQINPVFEIYIDNAGNVVDVNLRNEDARNVAAGLSLKGMKAEKAVELLLQKTNEKGYFSEEARPVEIHIESSGADLPNGMHDTLRLSTLQTVVEFTAEENVSLELRLNMWDKTIVDTVIKDGKADDPSAEVTFDPNTKTTSETVNSENGGTVIKTYDSQYRLISEKSTIPGFGTVEKIYDGNIVVREILDTPAGDHTVTDYWPNGKEKATEHQGADGRLLTAEYNENGKQIRCYEVMPDGTSMAFTHRDDGSLLSNVAIFPDGVIESTYNEQGDVILELVDRAGDRYRTEYTYSGSALSAMVTYFESGGTMEKLVVQYSGTTQICTEYYKNGAKIVRQYDGNGNVLSEVFYDTAGKKYNNVDDWSLNMNW